MIHTIGRGNRSIEERVALLKEAGIECLVAAGEATTCDHRLNPIARLREGDPVYDGATQVDLEF